MKCLNCYFEFCVTPSNPVSQRRGFVIIVEIFSVFIISGKQQKEALTQQ
jgi:hypothetical protein